MKVLVAVSLLFTLFSLNSTCATARAAGRHFTALAGVGNSVGLLGGSLEGYLGDQLSAFGGLGYSSGGDGLPSGAAYAAGVRIFSEGVKHRAYLELSYTQIVCSIPYSPELEGKCYYGPTVMIGY